MARPASRKAVSSLPAIANIDEQLDEVVMGEFIDIAQEKRNQAMSAIANKENQIIKEALAKHFGNDEFEVNAGKCVAHTDPKTGVRKVTHDGALLCEFHPIQISDDGDYRHKASFNYRMLD